jgi:prophage DNA circulation protein
MLEVLPHSVIYGLPKMTFRGLEAPPYDVAGFDFSHSHGVNAYPYINGASHDWTGLDSHKLNFTLYFLNSLEANAFPVKWEKWRKALFDGAYGEMVHPLLGTINVVVRTGNVALTAKSTAGVVVTVGFETTILDPEEEQTFESLSLSVVDAIASATAAASAAEVTLPSEESAVDLSQLGDQLSGAVTGLEMMADGLINKAQGIVSEIIELPAMADHSLYAVRDEFVTLWAALQELGEKVGIQKERGVSQAKVVNKTTLDAFARDRKNTVGEILSLNPEALASPSVSAGTTLRYYTS